MGSTTENEKPAEPTLRRKQKLCVCKVEIKDPFWIQCDNCDHWYHGICVQMSDSLSKQIVHWYCSECVSNGAQIEWNPKCSRAECIDYRRNSSLYCSDGCGLKVAASRAQFIYKSTPKSLEIKHYISELQELIVEREELKKEIRFFESKQLFLDDLIEKVQNKRKEGDAAKICGFDQNYINYSGEEREPLECTATGRCAKHDGWELIKSHEVQCELDERIQKYQELKKRELFLLAILK